MQKIANKLRGTMQGHLLLPAVLAIAACAPLRAPSPEAGSPWPPVLEAPSTAFESRFEGDLLETLRGAGSSERHRVLVDLTRQLDYEALAVLLPRRARSKEERRAVVVGALERIAEEQQALLRPVWETLLENGALDYVRPVAVVNRLLVEGTAPGILALARRDEVWRVMPDWTSKTVTPSQGRPQGRPEWPFDPSWAVEASGARELWRRGLTGRGVVVAVLDTGAFAGHEQLAGRQLEGPRGWFDPVQQLDHPYDTHGHGTAVLSVAVGGNPHGRIIGLAPGARWSAGLANWRNFYNRWRMTEAADWVLRVCRPDVLINAWSDDAAPCTTFDLPFVNAWKASGIFVVFPAGNRGPGSGTAESPASLAGAFPRGAPVFSVGALDQPERVLRTSSRGPSPCADRVFPTLSAPGARLPHAFPGGPASYLEGDGTSLAAAVVGGGAALLLEADPELTPEALEAVLRETARDVPPPGADPDTGWGALDLVRALERVLDRRGGPSGSPTEGAS